jgi:Fibronectin type III domain
VKRRLARPLIVAVLALGTFLAPGWAAYALWSSTATATLSGVSTAPAPAVPGAPGNAACTGATRVLSWTAPSTGGAPTGYNVYRDNGNSVGTTTSTTFTLTEAAMGSPQQTNGKYTVLVKAYNISGEGAASATVPVQFKGNGC